MKVGLGVTTLSKPRLATSVPTVVSAIDRPTARLNVNVEFTRICPNSLAFAASASRCSGCMLCVMAENIRLRSEEHTSELQSLMRISYAVFCLKKKKTYKYDIRT